ncbi:MAG: Hpt domain-containing protein [Colwellia sp.]|nr:Hpt domain-containing protein [Colwellia sp.]
MNRHNELPSLDEELLDGYVQNLGQDIVKQMFALYSQQSSVYLADIEEALLSDNAKLWQEHCHKMKGAAGSVGLKSLHARLVIMEKSTDCTIKKAQQLAELNIHNKQSIADFSDWFEAL